MPNKRKPKSKKVDSLVVEPTPVQSVKLDLGASTIWPEGYTPMGKTHGTEVYPLDVPDGSVDVIRASHVLEHFPWQLHLHIVQNWASKLKPGGTLKIAVPDLAWIAKNYLDGVDFPIEAYLFGGQVDEWDFHYGAFDEEKLKECLMASGLINIKRWESDIPGGAGLPVSLNLEGTKPRKVVPHKDEEFNVSAVMSVPRLGFMDNFFCTFEALTPMGIRIHRFQGAYWDAALERSMSGAIEADNPDAILTLDYDTVYTRADVEKLIQTMRERPEVDALAALQSARHADCVLLTLPDGQAKDGQVTPGIFGDDITELATAHFGLTLIRTSSLLKAKKPWFRAVPADDGTWASSSEGGNGRIDSDIFFWKNWRDSGLKVFSANRVPVGHLELMLRWPGRDLVTVVQNLKDHREHGVPLRIWQ